MGKKEVLSFSVVVSVDSCLEIVAAISSDEMQQSDDEGNSILPC